MISLLLAVAVFQAAPSDPVGSAAETFNVCVRGKVMAVPADVSPEVGTDNAWSACAAERVVLEQAVETAIASAPPEVQATMRADFKANMAGGRSQVVEALRMLRQTPAK